MAGSQLKRLKASLKAAGLTGQTNVKKKGKKAKTPSETRRDDKTQIVEQIRQEFNPFEVKTNRVKRDINEARKSKQVVGKPGISKQIGEEQRKRVYEETKSAKNRVGGIVDRRFGENNPDMNPEEKMLARFTRERQITSKKTSMFNLDDASDDDEYGGMQLTHYGQSLSLDDDEGLPAANGGSNSSGEQEDHDGQPARKKTKAEVMKEVIAKSKFYKHQRQMEQQKNEEDILELDEDFDDVMAELQSIKQPKSAAFAAKSETDIAYDAKIKELAFDRRSVPADRTKTQEELESERAEKMAKLESDRLRRMQGLDPEGENRASATGDDLDDDFWGAEGSADEAEGFSIKNSDGEESGSESESSSEHEDDAPRFKPTGENVIKIGNRVIKSSTSSKISQLPCPTTQQEFADLLENHKFTETNDVVRQILNTYQPKLAAGNKEKMAHFSGVLLSHILYLADHQASYPTEEFAKVIEELISQLRKMTEKYNETLYETFKSKVTEIQEHMNDSYGSYEPRVSDLVFYAIVGKFYSTSDLYHLIVTPTLILITETLEILKIRHDFKNLVKGIFLSELLLQYQRLSKRFVPELTSFMERALLALVPDLEKLDINRLSTLSSTKFKSKYGFAPKDTLDAAVDLRLELSIFDKDLSMPSRQLKSQALLRLVSILDQFQAMYKSEPAFVESVAPFVYILKHLIKYQASVSVISDLLSKLTKLSQNATHVPLKLQDHKPIAIASNVPKFEENFNPMKKSYDFDPQRQEINKLKAQLKKERKLTLKDIRKDSRFEARAQIGEKKQQYEEYHKKMANIVNSISTVEGAEKNEYEREKKARKNRR